VDDALMGAVDTGYGAWQPASPGEVAALFRSVSVPWWIAGGHAIEFAAGRRLRDHADIDVLLLRRHQLATQQALPGWEWWAVDPPGTLRQWAAGEHLPARVHDIWCRPGPDRPWRIQVMLDESAGLDWLSRRDPGIRRPIAHLGMISVDGIPYLAPEIQLLYKAKNPRPKDETDFTAVLPALTTGQRHWLGEALVRAYGSHPWLPRLSG
jgi:hypothetical protein